MVSHSQSIGEPQVNLMLTGSNLMMTTLHLDPHFLQGEDRFLTEITGQILWNKIKVATLVQSLRRYLARFEIKIFQLWSYVEGVSQISRSLEGFF
ncbi:hypothetical protein ES703_125465 [subsurface metagenome]